MLKFSKTKKLNIKELSVRQYDVGYLYGCDKGIGNLEEKIKENLNSVHSENMEDEKGEV